MELVTAQTADQVKTFVERNHECLFRGQNAFYIDDDGKPSVPTSFSRHGCVPPLMLKWAHYANELLRVFRGEHASHWSIEFSQALLQHYGWRSFYIDLTSSSFVASWFAAHKFHPSMQIFAAEDCFEQGLMYTGDAASYHLSAGYSYLLAIDRALLQDAENSRVIDLAGTISADFPTRFEAQSALLFGPCERLPSKSVVACLKAPANLLAEYAAEGGIRDTSSLFPSRDKDGFLAGFLSTPYVKRGDVGGLPVFSKELELPEYDFQFRKRQPPNVAFYSGAWVSDDVSFEQEESEICRIKVPDYALHAAGTLPDSLGFLFDAMGDAKLLVVEASGILRHIESMNGYVYSKGVAVHALSEDLFRVSELIVEHPGCQVSGVGLEMGLHYRRVHCRLVREESSDDCTCNNPFKHALHIRFLKVVNDLLADGQIAKKRDGRFDHVDLQSA